MNHAQPKEMLLVDDDPHDRELTLGALQAAGLGGSVAVARDGIEAGEFLFGKNGKTASLEVALLRVIILGLKAAEADAIELVRRIKAEDATRKVPLVVLSSSREQCDVTQCYRLGVNSYIVKPADPAEFCRTVRELSLYWVSVNEPQQSQE